jgi:sulfur-carrier protein
VAEPATRPDGPQPICVTVRYFAAARAAADADLQTLTVRPGATVAEVLHNVARGNPRLSTVLSRCSYLCDGIAVSAQAAGSRRLESGSTVDVLPPFSGG